MVISYKNVNGQVVRQIVTGQPDRKTPRGESRPPKHFSETLLRAYYRLECDLGSRFRSRWSKNTIKNAHQTAIERFQQTGAES